MFDYLSSHMPLAECDVVSETEFQTKDLECVLAHYVIDAFGHLLRCRSIADDPLDLTGAEDTHHHGDIRFHGQGHDGAWLDFVARFTDGSLEWVRRDHEAEQAMRARGRTSSDVVQRRIGSSVDDFLEQEGIALKPSARAAGKAAVTTETHRDGMRPADFRIGGAFTCGGRRWRCTDLGSRVVVAIPLEHDNDPGWYKGPPYAVVETVFDEDDQPGCQPEPADRPGRRPRGRG